MRRRQVGYLSGRLLVLAFAMAPLAACSTAGFAGMSSFGNNQLQVAELPTSANFTADSALSEARNHFRNNDFGYSAALYKRWWSCRRRTRKAMWASALPTTGSAASTCRIGVYATLFALSGGTPQYYNNLGYSYMLRGNLTLALTNFKKARKLDPANVVVANNMQLMAKATAAPV